MTTLRELKNQLQNSSIADDAIISAIHDPVAIYGMDLTGRFVPIAKIDSVQDIKTHFNNIEKACEEKED